MKILALDCGKNKSVFVDYQTAGGPREYGKIPTRAADVHDLLVERKPDVFVLEAGSDAGWICDLAAALGVQTKVANTNDERWQWKRNKKKTDRMDALKMAQITEMGSLPTVHVPEPRIRQWRSLIQYRHTLVVEVSWLGIRTNAWMKQVYEDVRRGSDKRKKIAIVAVARRLWIRLWAMLRDGTTWKEPAPRGAALATVGG